MAVETVKMVKQDAEGKVIATADVHPTMIADYQSGGWILAEKPPATPKKSPKGKTSERD
jgi:hypothetical protein